MAAKSDRPLRVSIEGMEEASRIPGWLERGQRDLVELAGKRLRDSVRDAMPGRSLDSEIDSRVLSDTRAEIRSDHPGVRAIDKGAFIRSKRGEGTATRFNAGGQRFIRHPGGTRIKARGVFKKGLRPRKKIVSGAFADVFRDLERRAA